MDDCNQVGKKVIVTKLKVCLALTCKVFGYAIASTISQENLFFYIFTKSTFAMASPIFCNGHTETSTHG